MSDSDPRHIHTFVLTVNDSTNVSVQQSNNRVDPKSLNIPAHEDKAPAPIDPSIDKWFYISGASA